MAVGMGIGFLMNIIWVAVGIGVLPLAIGKHSIIYAFEHGLPATVPIAQTMHMPVFSVLATIFALVAICTSYVANGMGLTDFNRDLLENTIGASGKIIIAGLTFLPPLFVAIFFPQIFLKAIGLVGGVGIAVLFGVLPAIIFFLKAKTLKARLLAVVMALLFLAALGSDLLNDFGIIDSSAATGEIKLKAETENLK